eukprot:18662-Heterococcus_DN1.PRE.3
MDAAHARKRGSTGNSNPLLQREILQHVLSYVGPGHCFFVSSVNSLWRLLYAELADVDMQRTLPFRHEGVFTCTPQMT